MTTVKSELKFFPLFGLSPKNCAPVTIEPNSRTQELLEPSLVKLALLCSTKSTRVEADKVGPGEPTSVTVTTLTLC